MEKLRDGPTRLATRAVDSEGRAYTDHGTRAHWFEEEGEHYFKHKPDEEIELRLSKIQEIQGVFVWKSRWAAILREIPELR